MKTLQSVLLASAVLALSACAGQSANLRASGPAPVEAAVSLAVEREALASPAEGEPSSIAPLARARIPTQPIEQASAATVGYGADVRRDEAPDESAEAEETAAALYTGAAVRDPWERYNRRIHRFNSAVDKRVLRPLAVGYAKAIPARVRSGVSNFFGNLGQPATAINQALQGRPVPALKSLGRFAVNTTLGIAGVFDPAAYMGLPEHDGEDFGQTLASWGWRDSRYLVMPLLGPRTVRDAAAIVADQRLSPLAYLGDRGAASALQLLEIVDGRTQLMPMDRIRQEVYDDYTFVRDAWTQRRRHRIDEREADD
ncbi:MULTISPECIES: VacJ family lipoprotein [unclassified Lysobacter]|uniref:MlaA family lipoprotein n=1 Tax=unclassified Lysobacter TaxID=2635362 RepID=UPI001BE8BE3A|nr:MULTISPECIES: VacJ family lipoprotein [unclassified Lysobacter]MBT2748741.1 VacJ family lipoprotein [Lysobacter sp. ISL-42]MBT2751676.1 VacJ family lipoprotein [Lysobacter sp. ISL-50]MBT2775870.1 VacJ family lipoprotein [Lysobacter sp. ISL-54]MBT2782166.1 VacJ family lipoprotein [Lysobacter sp. ISL-52]